MGVTEVVGDLRGDFARGVEAGVDGEAGGRHGERVEGAFGLQLLEEVDGGELAVEVARGVGEAALNFVEGADEFDEDDFAAGGFHGGHGLIEEGAADGSFGGEGEDEAGELRAASLVEDGEPDLLAEFDEGRAAEIEDGEEEVDGEVVVEEFVTGFGREAPAR